MDPLFEPFNSVARVEVPQHVYSAIQHRIELNSQRQRRWLSAVAAVAMLVWGAQVYTMVDHFNQVDSSYAINASEGDISEYYSLDNQLYDYE